MGQTLSSAGRHSNDSSPWPPPKIATPEQFKERFRDLFGSACILPAQMEWLRMVTANFGTTQDGLNYWTEDGLANFLSITLPSELHEDIQRARPLVYRCLLQLGSYPYLNQSATTLTTDVMRVALAILLQQVRGPVGIIGQALDTEETRAHAMRSLLFQSMRVAQPTVERQGLKRTEADDDHLLKTHRYISEFNYRRHHRFATRVEWGPPIIPVEDLPSSDSADFSGTIPRDQLFSFVKVCSKLASQHKDHRQQLEVLGGQGSKGIGWQDFEAAIGSVKVGEETYLLDGIALLFTPFIMPPAGVSMDSIRSASKEDLLELLREGGPPSTNAKYK